VYSHQLAIILPLGGVLGGIGGGAVADFVAGRFPEGRKWLLQGSAALSAPLIAASVLAPDPNWSMALLFPGFMLSEVRADVALSTPLYITEGNSCREQSTPDHSKGPNRPTE
jgi:hypothetical protein